MLSGRSSPRKTVTFGGMNGVSEEKGGRDGYDSQRYGAMATNAISGGGGGGGDGLDSSQDEQELVKLMEQQLNRSLEEEEEEEDEDVPRLKLSLSPNATRQLSGPPISPQEAEWFLHPKHLGPDTPASLSTPSHARPAGTVGAKLAHDKENDASSTISNGGGNLTNLRDPSLDSLAKTYFPLTLGTTFYTESGAASPTPTAALAAPAPSNSSPAPTASLSGSSNALGASRSGSRPPSRTKFQNGGIRNEERDSKELHLMRVQAPETASSSTVLLTSPYQVDLAKLRMERLRIEEERLLEMKRIEELERIRGPSEAWYELKNDRFHYEAHKNNEMIRNQNLLGATDEYKTEILRASRQFSTQSKLHKSLD